MHSRLSGLVRAPLIPLLLAGVLAGCDDPGATLSGAVVKGITANALITARDADGNVLGTTLTDAQGGYSLTLPGGYSGPVRLEATVNDLPATLSRCDALSGCGTFGAGDPLDINGNLAVDFGEWAPPAPDFSLTAVTVAEAGVVQAVNLSPVTAMAAAWVDDFPQGIDARSVAAANSRAAELFGLTAADLDAPAGDITDPLWTHVASAGQVKAALVQATFAEAAARFSMPPQTIVNAVANSFASQEGRILQADAVPSVNLALLLGVLHDLTENVDMDETVRTQLLADIEAQQATLVVGELTGHPEVSIDYLLDKLGPMGDQLQQLRQITGLDDFDSFLTTQEPFFSWLWNEDNRKLAPLGVEVVFYSVMGSLMLDYMAVDAGPQTLMSDNCGFSLVLDPASKTLRWQGVRFGQTLDLTVNLTAFQAGLDSGLFNFGINGTLVNATASGDITGTLGVDFGDTNLVPLKDALYSGTNQDLKQALYDLAYSMTMTVTLDGEAHLVRSGDFDPPQELGGSVSLVGTIDLGAQAGETIATLDVSSAELMLPNGTHLWGLPGTSVLTVNIADDATVVIDGAGDVLGIPTAYAHAEGTLFNAREIVDHVRNVLAGALLQDSVDLPTVATDLLDFDFSQLSATGEGVITIPDLGHEYRASLDDLTVTVYQPHSTDVAMTATLDPDALAVHYMIGDEPWEQRILTTPELRTTLMGPDGQFWELTQTDVMNFLAPIIDELFNSDLFADLGNVEASECGGGGGGGGGTDAPAIGLFLNGEVIDKLVAGTASLHVNFTGVLPKATESYFARWYIDGVHRPELDGLLEGDLPTDSLGTGSHTIRAELTDLTALLPSVLRISTTLSVVPQPVVITPDTSILDGVSISIKQNGVEVRRAPEGAENVEVTLVGFNPPAGSNYILRWYLDGVHYPDYDNQVSASAMVNPLTRGNHTLRLEITNQDAPTQSTVRMAEMVVVTPGETAGATGLAWLALLAAAGMLRRRRAA